MTDAELVAATQAVRQAINASGYGNFVSDEQCEIVAKAVLEAAEIVRDEADA